MSQGGLGMVKVSDFFHSLKCSWIRRYTIGLLNDHWTDQLDQILQLSPATRENMLLWGSERFNALLLDPKPCITGFLASYAILKSKFPTDLSTGDNSWFTQPVFFNKKLQLNRMQGREKLYAVPGDFGLNPEMAKLRICDLYSNLRFINKETFDTINGRISEDQNFQGLRNFVRSKIGPRKLFPGIPTFNPNPPEFSHDSVAALMRKFNKGSSHFRKIIQRDPEEKSNHHPFRPENWRKNFRITQSPTFR